jgi:hypothetical protein
MDDDDVVLLRERNNTLEKLRRALAPVGLFG